ncbi:MAG: aminopeptidase [Muribaculaceae bacterium]|nr:aminopeptidase [Muribaculaceae bacterium]
MKKLIALAVAGSSLAAMAQAPADSAATDSVKGFDFVDEIVIPGTSVKDQNQSGTCWCFAGAGFFENEIRKATGDSIDLSEMYVVRKCYEDKADRYVRMYGDTNFSPGGSVLDLPYVWKRYGIMPEEAYKGLEYGEDKHVHGELHSALKGVVKAAVEKPNRKVSKAWRKALGGVLDAYLGEVPETFTYNGKTYTPQSFAKSLGVSPDNYIAVTSFTHHPFYEEFIVEVPDNWLWAPYMNVPMDEMKAIVDNALANGYTVSWAADVSEGGFKWNDGVALMPKGKNERDMTGTELSRWVKLSDKDRAADKFNFNGPVEEIEVTQELRQDMFDSQETTDDHGMVIVGTARDREGNRYYKVKNSWDTNQVYGGYLYVSEPYFLAKTVDIYVNKAAVPAAIAKKIGLKK